jgi:hypothetical protein
MERLIYTFTQTAKWSETASKMRGELCGRYAFSLANVRPMRFEIGEPAAFRLIRRTARTRRRPASAFESLTSPGRPCTVGGGPSAQRCSSISTAASVSFGLAYNKRRRSTLRPQFASGVGDVDSVSAQNLHNHVGVQMLYAGGNDSAIAVIYRPDLIRTQRS